MSSDLDYYKGLEDFEDIEPYLSYDPVEESIGDENFPPFKPDFSSAIIIENIPTLTKEKITKFLSVLMKIYKQISSDISETDVHIPFGEDTGTTYGFCFIKFKNKEDAANAIKVTQGFAIDKTHSFKVSLYSDLDKYSKMPDEYIAPPPIPFHPRPDPTTWLTDPQCRDQFVIRFSHETQIYWANHIGDSDLVYGGDREKADGKVWCEKYVRWSPQGTYLATFHDLGLKLWGSQDFQPQGRFEHAKVEELSFSPCETYLVSYRIHTFAPNLNPSESIIVWDIRSGSKLRSFEFKSPLDVKYYVQATISEEKNQKRIERVIRGKVTSYEGDNTGGFFTIEEGSTTHERVPSDKVQPIQDPNKFKWSSDGKYLARLGVDMISVYTLPSMKLLDSKSIAAKEVLDFAWSPKLNLISYWSPAESNHPALINIIKIPTRQDICSRPLFDVTDGHMVWQNEGDYLCVHMTKIQGKKKSYVLMFFRVRDAGVPVEQLELNDPILHVSWEPSGDRLAIIYGDARSPVIAFYSMSTVVASGPKSAAVVQNKLTHLFTKNNTQCTDILWSPAGGIVAIAYFAPDSCIFELYDVENNVSLTPNGGKRHDRCTKLYWDPSGRYIVSATVIDLRNSNAKGNPEDGFNIYTFQGTLVSRVKREKLFQFAWRPRPKDLLTQDEKKKVIKNIKKYERMFEREDRIRKQGLDQEIQAARHKQASEFLTWMKRNKAISAQLKPRRVFIRNGYDSDDDRNYRVESLVEETILSTKDQFV
eukprot:gene10302-13848_t